MCRSKHATRVLGVRPRLRRLRRPRIALIALVATLAIGYAIDAAHGDSRHADLRGSAVALSMLPAQASDTVRRIETGGPFPYRQDGEIFVNAGHGLPARPRGYYHEYTVTTPGSAGRGTRRIITGRGGEYYYTSDHDETFRRVDVRR
jgi:ribonuclease T1